MKLVAAVITSSSVWTTIGTLLQPGDFKSRSSTLHVRSIVVGKQTSFLFSITKVGTFNAITKPKCSFVVPTIHKKYKNQLSKKKTRATVFILPSEIFTKFAMEEPIKFCFLTQSIPPSSPQNLTADRQLTGPFDINANRDNDKHSICLFRRIRPSKCALNVGVNLVQHKMILLPLFISHNDIKVIMIINHHHKLN